MGQDFLDFLLWLLLTLQSCRTAGCWGVCGQESVREISRGGGDCQGLCLAYVSFIMGFLR